MDATTQWEGGAIGRQTESDESSGVSIPFELCHSFRFVVAAATPLNMSASEMEPNQPMHLSMKASSSLYTCRTTSGFRENTRYFLYKLMT
jgi:hypothetical protein